jgi:biotin carboxylase
MITILCMTQFNKGHRLLEAFKKLGCRTVLLGTAYVRRKDWDPALVDEKFFVHDFDDEQSLLNSVSYLAQDRRIDLVVPLEEFSLEAASKVRSHLGCPGVCEGVTRRARDKLAMRITAQKAGIPVPEFAPLINRREISDFMERVAPPWMIKPRMAGGACQIRKVHNPEGVWKVYEELGDRRSRHLIEAFVAGEVYHVDSVVYRGKVVAAVAAEYGTPPYAVWHGGGVFSSRTVPSGSARAKELLKLNEQVIRAVGIEQGVNHVEFLGRGKDLYFLEIGARVAGANLDRLTTAAKGVELFMESARLELEWLHPGTYSPPKAHQGEAGILICLSKDQEPSLAFCEGFEEVVWTLQKENHAGCTFASKDSKRVEAIMKAINENLLRDHLAVLPPTEKPG